MVQDRVRGVIEADRVVATLFVAGEPRRVRVNQRLVATDASDGVRVERPGERPRRIKEKQDNGGKQERRRRQADPFKDTHKKPSLQNLPGPPDK